MPGWAWAHRRTRGLRDRLGPEYDRTLDDAKSKREAQSELAAGAERRAELGIAPLPPGARERYVAEWQRVQARFVDDPQGAAREADMLLQAVMQDRGYPADDFDQRAADVRAGALGDATTEELRRAMQHYRALFDELVGERESATPDAAIAARS